MATQLERFWRYIDMQPNGCWQWTGAIDKDGYGHFGPEHGKRVRAHRWAYEKYVGPIPAGLTLDHLCNRPGCVNPGHLIPATVGANMLRGSSPSAVNARKSECPKGHPLDGSFISNGKKKRRCLICHRENERARRAS